MSTSVLVRGFDFGTSTDVIWSHCSSAGGIESVEMSGPGSAVVKFTTSDEANQAVNNLNRTTLPGNKRYVDVIFDLKAGEKRGTPVSGVEVFVRGFDFGTTDEQLEGHCGSVGQIVKVHWITKGSAVVHYSTPDEAAAAVSTLNGTTIEGNSRFIDVTPDDGSDHRLAKKSKVAFEKGKGEWSQQNANPWQSMMALMQSASPMMAMMQGANPWLQSGAKSEGKGKGNPQTNPDPFGSGRVYVRGFDFGTSDDQLLFHMQTAGEVIDVQPVCKGSAIVVFKTVAMANIAVSSLHRTTIQGNSRYIDVIAKESESASPMMAMMQNANPWQQSGAKSEGKGKGNPETKPDPFGSGRVYVRGFDFGTSDDQLLFHMQTAGEVLDIHSVCKGSAIVVFKTAAMANIAVSSLHRTTIQGNSRYIDVIAKESE